MEKCKTRSPPLPPSKRPPDIPDPLWQLVILPTVLALATYAAVNAWSLLP